MMKMKYVMFDQVFPVIWHGPMNHCDARLVPAISAEPIEPTSAGFVSIVDGVLKCEGRSETLNMGPAEDDTFLLAKYMGVRSE